jgi:8-oxo-dGTP diphosphatase
VAVTLVTAAVIRQGDRLLIARRGAGRLAGYWEFAGGKVEPGETAEAALARELHEELGLSAKIGPLLFATDIPTNDGARSALRLLFLRVESFSGTPSPREHDRLAWVAVPDLDSYPFAPADVAFVRALMAGDAQP